MVLGFYDLETTGFNRVHNDIIEIAAIAWDSEKEEIISEFSSYIKPSTTIPKNISDLTGITNAMVYNSPKYWEILPTFFVWLKENGVEKMVGYNNTVFDWPFIKGQNMRYKLDQQYNLPDYPQIDVMKIVREMEKKGQLEIKQFCLNKGLTKLSVRQPIVAEYFDIKYDAHDAIDDVNALIKIYWHLRQINFNLD